MKSIVAAILAMTATSAAAGDWRILRPTDIYVDAYKYENLDDPYISPIDKDITYGGLFNVSFDFVKYRGYGLYMKNQLHFDESGRDGRIKRGGWQYELGAVVWVNHKGNAKVELFKDHHSQHIFEDTRPEHFPVQDRYGLRLQIYP